MPVDFPKFQAARDFREIAKQTLENLERRKLKIELKQIPD